MDIAKESLASARRAIRPADEVECESSVKAEIQAWLTAEAKKYVMRVGQLDRRIARALQLVTLWRREVKAKQDAKTLEELKDTVVDKAKAITTEEIMDPLEDAIREAELTCQTLNVGRPGSKKPEELKALEMVAMGGIQKAQNALDEGRKKLYPFDENLGDKVQLELRNLIAPFIRTHEIRLGHHEKRVQRVEKLLENFQAEIKKMNAIKVQKVKAAVTRLLRLAAKSEEDMHLSPEDLFHQIDSDGDDKISETEWVDFLENSQNVVRKMEIDKSLLPLLELKKNDLEIVFEDLAIGSMTKAITKPEFLKLLPRHMQCMRATTMTAGINIATTKTIRQLRPGEYVEVFDGPGRDPNLDVDRLQVKALEDGAMGWATCIGNGGSLFLKEAKPPATTN